MRVFNYLRREKDDRGIRWSFLLWGGPENNKRLLELRSSLYFKTSLGTGFEWHIGNRSSETPFDYYITIFGFAWFFQVNFPGLGRICEIIGGGHKRDISLRFFDHKVWWKLWYDDDNGYDAYHKCDGRRKLWWWPFKNKKYRSWACLRDGNLALNPLTAMWGERYYHYTTLEEQDGLIMPQQFPNDVYMVHFKLQKMEQYRENGPKWARGFKDQGYVADWTAEDKGGIPVCNDSWKGDGIYGSAERVSGPPDNDYEFWPWLNEAKASLEKRVKADRAKNRFYEELQT